MQSLGSDCLTVSSDYDSAEHQCGEVPGTVSVALVQRVRGDATGELGEGGGPVVEDGGLLVVTEVAATDTIEPRCGGDEKCRRGALLGGLLQNRKARSRRCWQASAPSLLLRRKAKNHSETRLASRGRALAP